MRLFMEFMLKSIITLALSTGFNFDIPTYYETRFIKLALGLMSS